MPPSDIEIFSPYVVRKHAILAWCKMRPSRYFVLCFLSKETKFIGYDELRASEKHTGDCPHRTPAHTQPLQVYQYPPPRNHGQHSCRDYFVGSAAVGWTGAHDYSSSARAQGVAKFQHQRRHSPAAVSCAAAAVRWVSCCCMNV